MVSSFGDLPDKVAATGSNVSNRYKEPPLLARAPSSTARTLQIGHDTTLAHLEHSFFQVDIAKSGGDRPFTPEQIQNDLPPVSPAASSSNDEATDEITPLPLRHEAPSTRSPHAPRMIPLPSPPAMGLSELLSGGSPFQQPSEFSYFPDVQSEPARRPTMSPFRSYYGERPVAHKRVASIDQAPLSPLESPLTSGTQRPLSDSASTIFRSTFSLKGPKIRNTDSVLAPHGSFTSSRPKMSSSSSNRSSITSLESSISAVSRNVTVDSMDAARREKLEIAARKGDQLAMVQLGWKANAPSGERYTLGSMGNVWGSDLQPSNITRRSSQSSKDSSGSHAEPAPTPSRSKAQSDLFSDAARLTLRSNAMNNRRPTLPSPSEHTSPPIPSEHRSLPRSLKGRRH